MSEGDEKLLRAASAMIAQNENEGDSDSHLLGQPHLIDFTTHSNSQSNSQPIRQFRTWSSQPRRVISTAQILPLPNLQKEQAVWTSSPDSSESFDTPLSVRQRRRRQQLSTKRTKGLFSIKTNSMGLGEETFYGVERRDEPNTPSPIRYAPLMRSTSKFSMLDDEDEEEVEEVEGEGGRIRSINNDTERERQLWSAELVDMDIDTGGKEVGDENEDVDMEKRGREDSVVTVILSTPIKSIEESSSPKESGSEYGLGVKEESGSGSGKSPVHPRLKLIK
jgi:hypothetical protein